jgi:PAS domain S-box-containing protein
MKRAVDAAYVTGVSSAEGASEVGAALLGVACAVLVRAVLEPIVGLSHTSLTFFIFLFAAVVVAALVGFSPALLTLVFGALAAWFAFVAPRYTFPVSDPTAVSAMGVYLLSGPAIAYLASFYHVANLNAATARAMTTRAERLEQELAARNSADRQPTLEDRFRTPPEEMKDAAVYLLDDRGRHATWNKGVRRLLGYEKAEFLHLAAADLYPPEERAAAERDLTAAEQDGRAAEERFLLRKDGSRFWASLSYASVRGRENRLVGFACTVRDLTGLKQVEEELRSHREALAVAHDAAGLGAWQVELTTREVRFDARARAIFGLLPDVPVSNAAWRDALHPADRDRVVEVWLRALRERKPFSAEFRIVPPGGETRWVASMGRGTAPNSRGEPQRITGVVLDISERKQTEQRLQEVLRLEAVGQLAGGIAHDLNNMLSAILGFSDMLAQSLDPDDARLKDVEQITQAANRSASLTRQLLAFARREMIQPRALEVNAIIRRIEAMLRPVLGPNIELKLALDPEVGVVHADPGQVEQIVTNLALNARDAMPQGGRLIIATASRILGPGRLPSEPGTDVPTMGRYLQLAVSDTGVGMDRATLERIWEPFFTTKPVGSGTGLGLSAVYGAMRQSGGYVSAESAPGRGATVSVYWPELPYPPTPLVEEAAAPDVPGGHETVLIVEDEPLLRALAVRSLQTLGYHCLIAEGAAAALDVVERAGGAIDLVVTDVVMPGASGGALGELLAELRPDLPVLYTSGYSDEDAIRRGLLTEGRPFLQKPFAPADLARRVRELLDTPKSTV